MYVIIFTNSIRWNQYWSYIVIREDIFYEKGKMRIVIYNLQCMYCLLLHVMITLQLNCNS